MSTPAYTAPPPRSAMQTSNLKQHLGTGILALVLLTAPAWLHYVGGYNDIASRVLIYGLAAMGLNLLLGHTGGLSFGHAAYFGLGSYGVGLMLKYMTHNVLLALLGGTLLGGVVAAVLAPIAVRRRGIYFAMITIAIGQMFYFIAIRWQAVTGGYDGLTGFSRHTLHLFGFDWTMGSLGFYYLVVACFALGALVLWIVLNSPLGHTFVAIRENQKRLTFLGLPVQRYAAISFALSGLIVALAGGLNALLDNFTSPNTLNYTFSGDLVVIAVLGGMRNFWGPLVGAAIFVLVRDYASSVTDNWMSVIGLIFVLSVLFFPLGVMGFLQRKGKAS
ncbi:MULTISPECIES: branched-chain amino acid ABC transporter permease [unclassified Thiomonas]|uniref:branched-chain amino acid ABC transporter permease n=1 Tax=unclassified Thiomonas TaxID=2625466 RepID=UPI0004DBA4BB|nr:MULTISPECIES: branched-chain amino acid ABC transporter permease [unclassified Thiomonas]CDW92940.1 Inner-membrane translocator [Thiomonas sp. CB2]VDY05354.1 Inner-membrane translocator [Thiomonas sp. Bio17B3]VDY07483.1 Inner-membrane translocator [Thiomonas sp. Sup16B3]VDY13603.1 putative ABC-type branched-chain amino acid transport system, permease component, livM [Thiomonas sp. OC7]VDY17197.1 Inner-membrane translocator [Thiomonas sp. CB2]